MKTIVSYIFCFLLGLQLYAQNYRLQKIDVNSGLPSNTVRTIFKDSQGYIWIGTDAGLCKFDGKETEVFSTKDGLPGNKIWAITEDKYGLMWFGTYDNGVALFDGKSFKTLVFNDSINKEIRCVAYLPEYNCIGFGTQNGIIIILNRKVKFFKFKPDDNRKNNLLVISVQTEQNKMLFHPYYFAPSVEYDVSEETFSIASGYNRIGNYNVFGALIDDRGDTVVSYMGGGIAILKKDTVLFFNNTGMVTDMQKDKKGNVWLCGWDGSQTGQTGGIFRLKDDKLTDFTDSFGIDTRYLWSLFYDKDNDALWISTLDKGVYILKNNAFEYYDLLPVHGKINDFLITDSVVWVAADDFLIKMKGEEKSYFDKKFFSKYHSYAKEHCLSDFFKDEVNHLNFVSLGYDNKNQLHIAANYGFFKYNGNGDHFTFAGINRFPFFFEDDTLYTVGWSRLRKYSNPDDYESSVELVGDNYPVDVSKIVKHNEKTWFVSWSNGLFVFDNGVFYRLNNTCKELSSLIKDICFDSQKNIYVGQGGGEILICRYDSGILTHVETLNEKTGIIGNTINWICFTNNNYLLAGTDKGLNVICNPHDKKNRFVRFFDCKEGYCAPNSSLARVDSDNNVWVNTETGLLKINIELLIQYKVLGGIKITEITVNNISNPEILHLKRAKLCYDQNFISFHFNKINYSDAGKDIFYYRLLGQTEQWSEAGSNNRIDFYSLNSGEYEFQIRCFNKSNGKFGNTVSFRFIIMKPWWATWWFRAIMFVTIVSLVWLAVRIRIRKIKSESEKKTQINQQIAELEMKALQSQMNPHFVFNSINSIQNFVLGNQTDEALKYLAHFSQLLRSVLNYASLKFITIDEEMEFLTHYIELEKMRFENGFAFDIEISDNIHAEKTLLPPMMLQPLIENSIKHGQVYKQFDGKIVINFQLHNELLYCIVKDNGIGPVKASQKVQLTHSSKAINIIKERLKILYSNPETGLTIDELKTGGCKVTIIMNHQLISNS